MWQKCDGTYNVERLQFTLQPTYGKWTDSDS